MHEVQDRLKLEGENTAELIASRELTIFYDLTTRPSLDFKSSKKQPIPKASVGLETKCVQTVSLVTRLDVCMHD